MKKKSILLIYYKLFRAGGVAKVMTNLANELVKEDYNVEILLLSGEQTPFYELDKNIKIHYADIFSHWTWKICEFNAKHLRFIPKIHNINAYISHIGVFLLLKSWLGKNHHRYDTIISCWYKLSCFLATYKDTAKKTIAWEHTDYNSRGIIYSLKTRRFYKNLKTIVCINTPSINYYKQFSNTFFITNIIGEPFENKEYISVENKENIISFVGRLDKDKNVMELVNIFADAKIPEDWQLNIIGDGPKRENIEQIVKDKNLQNKVQLLGNKTTAEVSELLDKSKIFAFTSLREGLPTTLIEALFCSNALIAYNCNYGPSDIINERNGFLIPLGDKEYFKEKLEYLIQNTEKYYEFNKNSYIESQKWKKDKILKQWKEIL